MGLYNTFQTNEDLESQGVWVNYGDFKVLVARAGGGNKNYAKVAERVLSPYRRQLSSGTLDNSVADQKLREITAEACVLGWKTWDGNQFVDGIETPEGEIVAATNEQIVETFKNLPDLYTEIRSIADDMKVYRNAELEEEGKNSPTA